MNSIRFNCDACQRHWLFPEFRVHKMRGHCVRDPNAENSIEKLKGRSNHRIFTCMYSWWRCPRQKGHHGQ